MCSTCNRGTVVAAFWTDRLESHALTESMMVGAHVASPSVSSAGFLRDIFRFDKYLTSLARHSVRIACGSWCTMSLEISQHKWKLNYVCIICQT